MEEDNSFWLRRTNFSHTVCHRLDSSRLSAIPLVQSDHNLELKNKRAGLHSKLTSISLPVDRDSGLRAKGSISRSASLPSLSFSSQHDIDEASKAKRSSLKFPHGAISFDRDKKSATLNSSEEFSSPYLNFNKDTKPKPKKSSFEFSRSIFSSDQVTTLRANDLTSCSSASSYQYDQYLKWKTKKLNSGKVLESGTSVKTRSDPDSRMSTLYYNLSEQNYNARQRSVSPLPTIILSEAFKEARASEKRFSTPPPRRKRYDKSVFGKFFSREARDHNASLLLSPPETKSLQHLSSVKYSDKHKTRKETSWARYLDHAEGKANAVETADEWTVDLSQLYLGLRFASGAHSKLYQGIYKGQRVAVKIIRQPEDDENGIMAARLKKQFTREVTILSHLYHRNVIKLAGSCKQPPVFFIITEYLSGGSLRAFLHKLEHKSLPLEKLIAISLDIARGMEYIHSQGVIHRDLKPENIIFDQDFSVKIADFGIACEEAYCDTLAEDPGTYRWMAPEMIKHKPYGHKVDVYSFGLVLWEMVTGRVPYEEMTPIQAAFAVVDKNLRPVIPPDCPAPLRALIEQCWALHSDKRPEFWQIVKVLEQFESALAQGGKLEIVPNLTSQEHKNWLLHWIQKLKPSHAEVSGPPVPKLL